MNDLRKVQNSLTDVFLMRSRIQWAGHVERMPSGKLAKLAELIKIPRSQKKGKTTAKMGDMREEK